MNAPTSPASKFRITAPSDLRFVRGLAWLGLVLGGLFVIGLGVAPTFFGGGYFVAAAIVTVVVIFPFVSRRMLSSSWQRIGVHYVALATILTYLAIDDFRIRRPQTLEEFAPALPGDEKSYEVLMRYGKNHPLGHDFRFQPPQSLYRGKGVWNPSDAEWKNWLLSNRADIEKDWKQLDPVRTWWAELDTFDRIGDLTPPKVDAEIMAFGPVRAYTQHACAIASLQAIDGQGDAALETLIPVFEVGRKLTPSSRTLVRSMVAIIVQKMTMETANFILNTTEVSPAVRSHFAAALGDTTNDETNVRRLIGIEYVWAEEVWFRMGIGDIANSMLVGEGKAPGWCRRIINPLTPFVCNPRRSINLYGDLAADLADLAAQRKIKQLDQRSTEFARNEAHPRFKNLGGTYAITAAVPAYSKVVEAFWKTSDLRSALRSRLKA